VIPSVIDSCQVPEYGDLDFCFGKEKDDCGSNREEEQQQQQQQQKQQQQLMMFSL